MKCDPASLDFDKLQIIENCSLCFKELSILSHEKTPLKRIQCLDNILSISKLDRGFIAYYLYFMTGPFSEISISASALA